MSLKNPLLSLEQVADGAITEGYIVKLGTAADEVALAAAATDAIMGVAEHDAADGESVRIQFVGRAKVKAGGTITKGALVTSDANGKAVAAAPAAGVNNRILGMALIAAVDGDEFSVLLNPGSMQGA